MEHCPGSWKSQKQPRQIFLGLEAEKKPIMVHEVRSENSPQNGLPQIEEGKGPSCETEHINSFDE